MLDPLLIVELGLLGLCTGFLAGLLGIGGGMLLVPFLTYLLGARQVAPDLAVKMAIATSMATIVFTSVSSVRAHHKRGAVRWDIVTKLAPGIVLGGFVASLGVFALLKGRFLAVFFGLFVSFSAVQMFLDKKPAPTRQMPGTAGQLGAGGFIGFLSGLVGAGGGFVSVPFMTWCNVPIHNAVATSSALGVPVAIDLRRGRLQQALPQALAVPLKPRVAAQRHRVMVRHPSPFVVYPDLPVLADHRQLPALSRQTSRRQSFSSSNKRRKTTSSRLPGPACVCSASGRPSNRSPCTTAAAFSTLAAQAAWRR